jgi:hypothetical protein
VLIVRARRLLSAGHATLLRISSVDALLAPRAELPLLPHFNAAPLLSFSFRASREEDDSIFAAVNGHERARRQCVPMGARARRSLLARPAQYAPPVRRVV